MKRMIAGAAFAITAACLILACGCPSRPGGGQCAQEGATCVNDADCCAGLQCFASVCVPDAVHSPLRPAKTISFELIGVHDPNSDGYNGNCVECHGDRTDEVAMDGVTPAAHSRMLGLFGEGNDRCMRCHGSGPNFLTASAGGLREQVDMEDAACAVCHGVQPASGAPSFYAD